MNDRQLRSFILAADLSSFSKAAEASYISTPALVQQINLLEKNVGFSLFMRQPRGVKLTQAGKQFYHAAKDILRIYDDVCAKCNAIEAEENTTLRIACPNNRFPDFFMEAIRAFSDQHPHVKLQFIEIPFTRHFDALREGQIDLTLTSESNEIVMSQLQFTPLFEDVCAFCMRPDHPLAQHTRMTPELLRGATILCGNYTYMSKDFKEALSGISALKMDTEYGKGMGMRILQSDDIFVINSQWSETYSSFLAVIPSDIPSNMIGIIAKDKPALAVRQFIQYAKMHAPKR